MAAHLYAALLQEEAHRRACALLGSSLGGAGACPSSRACYNDAASHGSSGSGGSSSRIPGCRTGGAAAGEEHNKPRLKPLQRLRSLLSFRRRGRVVSGGSSRADGAPSASPTVCQGRQQHEGDASLSPPSAPSSRSCSPAPSCSGTPRSPASPGRDPSLGALLAGKGADGAEGEAEAYAQVAGLYRRAAGVYLHISSQLLPAAHVSGSAQAAGAAQVMEGAEAAEAALAAGTTLPAEGAQTAGPAQAAGSAQTGEAAGSPEADGGCSAGGPAELWPGYAGAFSSAGRVP